MSERALIICGNKDLVGGSTQTTCERCGAPIVVSLGTRRDAGPDAEAVCLSCGAAAIKEGSHRFGGIGPNQAREIAD